MNGAINFSSSLTQLVTTGAIVSIGLIALVAFILVPGYTRRHRRRRQLAIARHRAQQVPTDVPYRRSSSERIAAIENWLISKPALPHDEVCELVLQRIKEDGDLDADQECAICFEPFQAHDVISWSPNPMCCKKVFHYGCLREWLLHQNGCPWCRQTVLPMDGYSEKPVSQRKQIQDLLMAGQQRTKSCFYCIEHGIVCRSSERRVVGSDTDDIESKLRNREEFLYSRAFLADYVVDDVNVSMSSNTVDVEQGWVAPSQSMASTEHTDETNFSESVEPIPDDASDYSQTTLDRDEEPAIKM